jgi:uncharacterized protein YjiS (DUF1127 family)
MIAGRLQTPHVRCEAAAAVAPRDPLERAFCHFARVAPAHPRSCRTRRVLDDRTLDGIGITRAEAEFLKPQAVLEGMMNRQATREAAAIAGSPLRGHRPRSRPRLAAAPQERREQPETSALPGTPAAEILEELDVVVRNSHRRSGLRRMLHSVRSTLAKWMSRMAPKQPRQSDLPPEIWFPWY